MPILLRSPYREYEFTEDEICVAAVYTELQTQYLETQLARAVQERANLGLTPDRVDSEKMFIMEMEHLRGQIETYTFLLSTSEDLGARQRLLLAQQAERQQTE